MRIAMFMPGLARDSLGWQIYQDFADAIRRRGHGFEFLVTSDGGDPVAGSSPLRFSRAWGRVGDLLAPLLHVRSLVPGAAALRSYLREKGKDLDVLHVEIAYPLGTAALFAVALSGWRGLTVVTPMGEDVLVVKDASYGFRRFPVPRLLVSWTLRRAGAIRCISPLIRKLVDEEWPGPPAHTIPLNVASWALSLNEEPAETRRSRRSRARQTLLARSGIPDAPLVVALGRLHPFKGMDVLVEALRGVPSAHLLIAGPSLEVRPFGDAAKHLADIARARGLEERVHLLGSIPPGEALAILAAADVVAVPSYQESLNRVCIEAAAVGTPFVVTETTGIAAYVPDRGVGLIVPPRSPPALAEALSQVIDGRWSPDAAQASAFVRRFAPERIGEDMLGLYQSVGTASRRAGD